MSFAVTCAPFGFRPAPERLRETRIGAAVAVVVVLLIAIPLAYNTIPKWERSRYTVVAAHEIRDWDPALEIERIAVDATDDPVLFDIAVSGDAFPADPDDLADAIAADIGRPAQLDLILVQRTRVLADG